LPSDHGHTTGIGKRRPLGGRFLCFALIVASIVLADQLSKVWARAHLAGQGSQVFIPGLVNLQLAFNSGAAFSMLSGAKWFFICMAVLVTALIVCYLIFWGSGKLIEFIISGMVVGGAIGNLIDRIAYGYVTDFFDLAFMDFAIFNVADIFVTCGCIAFILIILFQGRRPVEGEEGSDHE